MEEKSNFSRKEGPHFLRSLLFSSFSRVRRKKLRCFPALVSVAFCGRRNSDHVCFPRELLRILREKSCRPKQQPATTETRKKWASNKAWKTGRIDLCFSPARAQNTFVKLRKDDFLLASFSANEKEAVQFLGRLQTPSFITKLLSSQLLRSERKDQKTKKLKIVN